MENKTHVKHSIKLAVWFKALHNTNNLTNLNVNHVQVIQKSGSLIFSVLNDFNGELLLSLQVCKHKAVIRY